MTVQSENAVMLTNQPEHPEFLKTALAWKGSITPKVIRLVIIYCAYSAIITLLFKDHQPVALDIGPFEVSGAVLGLLLVLRTNAGYDRWWEARKVWGGIVNQSRNLVISCLEYGGKDLAWRREVAAWIAAFPHVVKRSLRGERDLKELERFLKPQEINRIQDSRHMPSFVISQIAQCLQRVRVTNELDPFCFLQIDRERSLLTDHVGACERILKTPIPLVIAIKIRRFIFLFLTLVPFLLIQKVGMYTPIVMLFITYPIFSLDQIGIELQNPFGKENLSHLPLDEISQNIEKDVFSLLENYCSTAKK